MSSKPASDTGPAARTIPRRQWSLVARLTFWYAVSSFALIAGATGVLYWGLASSLDREDDQLLAGRVQIVQSVVQQHGLASSQLADEVQRRESADESLRIFVRLLQDGDVLLESAGMREFLPADQFPEPMIFSSQISGLNVSLTESSRTRSYRLASVVLPSTADDGAAITLQLALDRSHEAELLGEYRQLAWIILAVAMLGTVAVGYGIARRGLQPIDDIAAAAGRIGSSTLHERIDYAGLPAELSGLAQTFNEMLSRLEDSFQRLSQLSDDLAHELRTPIGNLRGTLEVALSSARTNDEYRDVLGSALEECGRLSQLIDNLLFLARVEHCTAAIQREPVDIRRELQRVQEFFQVAAEEANVELSVAGPGGWVAHVDRTLLQRALINLVDNAIRHSPPGGRVDIDADLDGNELVIEVADSGAGIPIGEQGRVFDRFYRGDTSRTVATGGTGLGLAIVKGIATLHGGKVTVSSEPGRGARFCLRLGLSDGVCLNHSNEHLIHVAQPEEPM